MKYKLTGSCCFLAMLFIVGCQSYEPAPLDMGLYRENLEQRLVEIEPVQAFAERIALRAGAPDTFDIQDGISPEEGEVIALFYNPELRIARLEAEVALSHLETAGLWKDPVFSFNGAEISSPSAPFQFGLMMDFTIPISGRLKIEKELAGSSYETQLREVASAEWNTRALVRQYWSQWTATTLQVTLLQDFIEQLERINTIADVLAESEEINRVERRLLHVELVTNQVKLSDAELRVIETESELLELLGLPPKGSTFLLPRFPMVEYVEVEDETTRLIDANTDLAIQFAKYRIAEDALRLEIKKQFPDIVIGSGYGSEFNDHRVLFGVYIPLSIWNRNQAGIAKARTNREVSRASAETTFARIFRELALANRTLSIKKTQRYQFEEVIVPILAEQSRDIDNIMQLGEVDTFILLETVTRQYEAKQHLVDLQLEELKAQIRRNQILGPQYQIEPSPLHREITSTDTLGGVQ